MTWLLTARVSLFGFALLRGFATNPPERRTDLARERVGRWLSRVG